MSAAVPLPLSASNSAITTFAPSLREPMTDRLANTSATAGNYHGLAFKSTSSRSAFLLFADCPICMCRAAKPLRLLAAYNIMRSFCGMGTVESMGVHQWE